MFEQMCCFEGLPSREGDGPGRTVAEAAGASASAAAGRFQGLQEGGYPITTQRQMAGEMGRDEWHLEGAEQHRPFQPNGQEAPAGEQIDFDNQQRMADLVGGQLAKSVCRGPCET